MNTRLIVALAAWLAAGIAFADSRQPEPPGMDIDRMAILLELDDTQNVAVQDVLEQQHAKMRAAHDEHHAAGTRPTREEMSQVREQMKQETVQKLQSVLTAEQITKFEALTDRPPRAPRE